MKLSLPNLLSLTSSRTGGIRYYSAREGYAYDSVTNFDVVLANGTLVQANADSHADLFRALKAAPITSASSSASTRKPSRKVYSRAASSSIPETSAIASSLRYPPTKPPRTSIPTRTSCSFLVIPWKDFRVRSIVLPRGSP